MWNCNSSASPVLPGAPVLPIVTQEAAADETGTTFARPGIRWVYLKSGTSDARRVVLRREPRGSDRQ